MAQDTSAKKNYQKALNKFIDDQTQDKLQDYQNFLKKKLKDVNIDELSEEFTRSYISKEVSVNSGKRGKKNVGKSKRAPSAYNIFVGEKIKELKGSGDPQENMQKAIKEWNNLADEEKQAYKETYKSQKLETENGQQNILSGKTISEPESD